jgi:hypothetical protein
MRKVKTGYQGSFACRQSWRMKIVQSGKELMQKFIIVLLTSFFIGCGSANQVQPEKDYPQDIKGRIKTIRLETTLLTDEAVNPSDGNNGNATTTTYDSQGREAEEIHTTPSGEILIRITTIYDNQGKKKEQLTYDAKNTPIGRKIFVYDNSGSLTEQVAYREKGTLQHRKTFAYNEQHLIKDMATYNARGAITEQLSYGYDTQGNKNEVTRYYAEGSIDRRRTFIFEDQNAIEMIEYNAQGEWLKKEKYSYEFDAKGNWTKRLTSRLLNLPDQKAYQMVEATKRTIGYY